MMCVSKYLVTRYNLSELSLKYWYEDPGPEYKSGVYFTVVCIVDVEVQFELKKK